MTEPFDRRVKPHFRLLTDEQIQTLHRATLQVLAQTGVRVAHEEGRRLLRAAGCRIERENIVRFPNSLVEECIRSAPSRVTIYNQQGAEAMRLEGRNSYYGTGTDLIATHDLRTGEKRPSVLQDVVNAARVADSCEQIDFIASLALPTDVPTNVMYIASVKAQLENADKPIFFTAAGRDDLAYIIEMAAAVAGGNEALRERPFLIHYSEPTPPLTHSVGAVSKLFLCAENGIPICYTPAAMLGGSAPVTIAGALVQTNAEALSGLVMHQLKAAGAPIISGVAIPPLDMKTSCISYSAPELRLGNAACADLYHYYGLPVWSTTGADAHTFDAQAAEEHALCTLMASLEGANLIHDVAYLGQGLLGNPAMIVMCNELIGYVRRIMRGFDIGPEMIGLENIHEAGPGGNYLTARHTLKHFRSELWQPSLFNRLNPDAWQAAGARRYEERVVEKTLAILESYSPEPLVDDVQKQLDAILARATKALAHVHFEV